MNGKAATISLCVMLGLAAGCSSIPQRDAAIERAPDPARVAQYNLEMERRAIIEAEARRRGVILIWAYAPIRPEA